MIALLALVLASAATWAPVVGAIIVALFGGGGVVAYRMIKPQSENLAAGTAKALSDAALSLVEPLRQENAVLRDRIVELNKLIELQQAEIKSLHSKVDELLRMERDRDNRADRSDDRATRGEARMDALEDGH